MREHYKHTGSSVEIFQQNAIYLRMCMSCKLALWAEIKHGSLGSLGSFIKKAKVNKGVADVLNVSCVFRIVRVCTRVGVLPSREDTSFRREGTAEAISERCDGLRGPFLDAPETNQSEPQTQKTELQSCGCTRPANQPRSSLHSCLSRLL